ncbi:glycosyltransferase [Thermosynechococcaceae cyanobacterium Okahandja]
MVDITIITFDLRCGGLERAFLDLAIQFIKKKYKVEFLVMQKFGSLLDEAEKICKIYSLDIKKIRYIRKPLASYLSSRKPKIVLVGMWPLTILVPMIVKINNYSNRLKTRVLISEQVMLSIKGDDWRKPYFMHSFIMRATMFLGYRLSDYRVATSYGVLSDIASLSCLSKSKFNVIYNPLRKLPMPTNKELEIVNNLWKSPFGNRILCVARLKRQKNHKLLLDAFYILFNQNLPNLSLMIVGEGELQNELTDYCNNLGISEKVTFAGLCINPAPFYCTANLFALSSDFEGFGNVLIEALSMGLPVVSTDCPSGPREILSDGKYGKLVPVGNANAFATAIMETFANPPDADFLKKRAKDFDSEKIADQYLSMMYQNE